MSGRSRLFYYADTVAGQSQTIAILEELPFNATLLQVSARFSPIPVTDEEIVINKISGQGAQYSVRLYTRNPYSEQGNWVVCRGPWEFRKGDFISVSYPNTSDGQVGVEVIFTEAD